MIAHISTRKEIFNNVGCTHQTKHVSNVYTLSIFDVLKTFQHVLCLVGNYDFFFHLLYHCPKCTITGVLSHGCLMCYDTSVNL
jgi:hypothetical protein